jgi:hypothetical protein
MADFNWRARVAKGPVGCKLEGRDELPVLADCSLSRRRCERVLCRHEPSRHDCPVRSKAAFEAPSARLN